jgi:AraC-like DNA-binding protein
MDYTFSIIDVLSLVALLTALMYCFQIITLKNRTSASRFFIFYLANITFIILFFFLLRLNLSDYIKYLIPVLLSAALMMPVNLWVYLKRLLTAGHGNRGFKHYILPILAGIFVLILLVMVVATKNKDFQILVFSWLKQSVIFIITVVFLLLNAVYLSLAFNLLRRHRKNIRNYYSYTTKVDLQWVKVMLFGYIFLISGLVICELINGLWSDLVFYTVLIVYLVYIGHNAFRQKEILSIDKGDYAVINEDLPEDEEKASDGNSAFSEFQLNAIQEVKKRLEFLMESDKPYLEHELTILKLAGLLETNTKYLSFIINNDYEQNFINYINEFRIEEVKRNLMERNQNFTIEAIAQNAGFKSKSAFNAAFKKSTGMTPSTYIKNEGNRNKANHTSQ